jgi:glucose-6-phosphate isomerase
MVQVVSQKFFINDPIAEQDREAINAAAKALFYNATPEQKIFKPTIDVAYLRALAKQIKLGCKHLVIIGTGASSNIPRILFSLRQTKEFRVHFLEDADTSKFENLISQLEPSSTKFLVITKSGKTIEILALLSLCLKWAEANLPLSDLGQRFYFITAQNKNNPVLDIAKKLKAITIDHPALSGRYSFFSPVGLLPAVLAGFDIALILSHATQCIDNLFTESSWILEGATYLYAMSKRYHNAVFMTYNISFHGLGLYLRQLISESLGKDGQGLNPVMFEGNIDQHSQLQSYLAGLSDKFFTVFVPGINLVNNNDYIDSSLVSLSYLKGKTLADINQLQINAVVELLREAKKNIRIIEVTNFNEKFVAEIVISFLAETILYAKLNAIDPFTQTSIDCMKLAVIEAVTV